MPFNTDTFFNPSNNYRTKWSLCPQDLHLEVDGVQTRAFLSSISSYIYLFHLLSLIAICLDLFLGFKVLKNAGVNYGQIIMQVVLDYVLAIFIYLLSFFKVNKIKIQNRNFKAKLESKSILKNETDEQYKSRRNNLLDNEIKESNANIRLIKIVKGITILLIFGVAFWKVTMYNSTLPSGMFIYKMATGKMVIICAVLCALFHSIATENSFAHLYFYIFYSGEYKKHLKNIARVQPSVTEREIPYIGNYNESKSGNTSIVKKDGKVYLTYIYVILDEEILFLINSQTDVDAKKGIAIIAKENQII